MYLNEYYTLWGKKDISFRNFNECFDYVIFYNE